tara:strand:+ start:1984 stop:2232 length:249 start_codon:yes stop_codon:yes gene_type:complete
MDSEPRTTDRKAKDYRGMGHCAAWIDAIRDGLEEDMTAEELKDTVSRNVKHLEFMVAFEDWGSEDMTAINAAITNGKAYLAS